MDHGPTHQFHSQPPTINHKSKSSASEFPHALPGHVQNSLSAPHRPMASTTVTANIQWQLIRSVKTQRSKKTLTEWPIDVRFYPISSSSTCGLFSLRKPFTEEGSKFWIQTDSEHCLTSQSSILNMRAHACHKDTHLSVSSSGWMSKLSELKSTRPK